MACTATVFAASLFTAKDFLKERKNRVWQRTHRKGTTPNRLSSFSSAPRVLERRISRHPHLRHTSGWLRLFIRDSPIDVVTAYRYSRRAGWHLRAAALWCRKTRMTTPTSVSSSRCSHENGNVAEHVQKECGSGFTSDECIEFTSPPVFQ